MLISRDFVAAAPEIWSVGWLYRFSASINENENFGLSPDVDAYRKNAYRLMQMPTVGQNNLQLC